MNFEMAEKMDKANKLDLIDSVLQGNRTIGIFGWVLRVKWHLHCAVGYEKK